jgi:mono/diheme cytochrome c family protein
MRNSTTNGLVFIGLLLSVVSLAQQAVTYQQHIAPILQKNCVTCHRAGGIGPFVLDNYTDVAKRSEFIAKVTQIRYMPPFPADRGFQHYANERGLSDDEIALIQQWVAQGAVEGQGAKAVARQKASGKRKGVFSSESDSRGVGGSEQRKPDLVLRMQRPFAVPNTGEEEYRYFHVPTGLKEDVMVEAIAFVAGNRKIVHHSRIMVDTSGKMASIDGLRGDSPDLVPFQKIPMADEFLYGWVPGNDRIQFPAGTGKRLKANANLIFYMHYSPSGIVQTDQSEIHLYFAKKPVEREIRSIILHEKYITNPPFLIPANQKATFYMSYGPLDEDISAISVLPHAHWLGKTFKVFGITPGGDLAPFVKIDNWDFNWQMTYQFDKLLHVPKGSVVLAEAQYDNTDQNPLNPFKPIRDVGFGWSTTSEMMEAVIYYVLYKEGDENVKQ